MTQVRSPLAVATAAISRMVLADAHREHGESSGMCVDCHNTPSGCSCERMARAALEGLFDAYYEIRESR